MRVRFETGRPHASRRSLLALAAAAALLLAPAASALAGSKERSDMSTSGGGSEPALREGVAGHVVTRAGKPLAGALIVPSPAGGGAGPVPEMAVQTDASGRFEWSLGPGRYRLDAISQGRTVASRGVTVARGRVVRVRLTTGGAR